MNGPERYHAYHRAIRTQTGAEGPAYDNGYRLTELGKASRARLKKFKRSANLPWIERGPGNVGGRTRGLWLDPRDSTHETLFAGSVGGGIWKTEDAGETWQNLTPDLPNLATATLAGGVNDPSIIYAGTGEGFGASNNALGDGIWKSVDGGESWLQLPSTAGGSDIALIYRLIVNPENADEIVFSTLSNPRAPRGTEVFSEIYKSVDGGQTIQSKFRSPDAIQHIVADPSNFDIIYATINGIGLMRSTDRGESWSLIYETDEYNRLEVAIAPTNVDHLYIAAQRPVNEDSRENSSQLIYSPDSGENWYEVQPIDNLNNFGDWFGGQGWYDNTVAVHPFDHETVFVGGAGPILKIRIERFSDSRDTYLGSMEPVTDGYGEYRRRFPEARSKGVHVDHHNLLMVPIDSASDLFYMINANDGGVAFSKDGGDTFLQTGDLFSEDCDDPNCRSTIRFETSKGYNTSQFYGVDKKNGSSQYVAGTQDNGSWVSPEDPLAGTSWNSAPSGDGFEAVWHYTKSNQLVESSQFNNVFRSDNGGRSWRQLSLPGDGPFLTRLAGSQQDPDLLYAVAAEGVLKSFDFGDHWQIVQMPATWRFEGLGTPIRISLANPNIVWTGSGLRENADMALSTDGGISFSVISRYARATLGLTTNIASHPFRDSTAYFLFSQANGPKIIRTTDLGKTLEDISGFITNQDESNNGYPDVATYSLLVMPYDENILWAGTDVGLFESIDGGQSWHLADNGMPNVAIFDMKIVNDEVVLATHGRGIWSVALPELEGYEPQPVAFLAPQILIEEASFANRITGRYALRSPADSNQLTFEFEMDGQSFIQTISLGSNTEEVQETFEELVADISGEDFVEVKTTISSFFEGSVLRSQTTALVHAINDDPVSFYATNFDDGQRDFARMDWTIEQAEDFDDVALHSPHPYSGNDEYVAVFQSPVLIQADATTVSYDEVVLVEPGDTDVFPSEDFFDYCLVEGTTDLGQSWVTIAAYDSRDQDIWISQYERDENDAGPDLILNRTFDLNDFFNAGDTVYLRFKLVSDPFVEGWGWSIDNFQIGEDATPTVEHNGIEISYELLSNPVHDQLRVLWKTAMQINLRVSISNIAGQLVESERKLIFGESITTWDVSSFQSGVYFLTIDDGDLRSTIKWIKL